MIINIPLFLIYKIIFFSNRKTFMTIAEFLSLFPGFLGYFLRYSFFRLTGNIGTNVNIGFRTILEHPTIKIKNDIYIGQNCTIGTATINKGVKIGSNVDIISGKYTHKIKKGKVMPTNNSNLKRIHIGKNTWIGNSVVIMANIGDNCIIGAGSVVVKPIPNNSKAVGNPAKVIKKNA